MIGLHALFWALIVLFAAIGFMRGWAKELIVTVAVILATFVINVLEGFVPFIQNNLAATHDVPGNPLFWLRIGILGTLVFFGYQTPSISKLASGNRFAREKLQDILLGTLLGAINGFLIWGTIWYYLMDMNYYPPLITPPPEGSAALEMAARLQAILPPVWLGRPAIYFAAALAFAFVIVVLV